MRKRRPLAVAETLRLWRGRVAEELDAVIAFWERHSHDTENGGFFSCLSEDGSVYDDTKYVWMQGRQVWMYSRLYRTVPRFRRPELLEAAIKGGEFLLRCAPLDAESPRVAFALSRDGRPAQLQRNAHSEAFCAMGLHELSRAAAQPRYAEAAQRWALAVWRWAPQRRDPQMELMEEWGARRLLAHLQRGDTAVLENIGPNDAELPGAVGRLQNPGHALEAGWLLLRYAQSRGDPSLAARVLKGFVDGPLEWGWDPRYGGVVAFCDVDGHCPTQLEARMKLWWPQLEAMVALLTAFAHTRRPQYLRRFHRVAQYAWSRFRDPKHGEWFGYLAYDGTTALSIKGGPYKGCFHLPRALLMCEELLDELLPHYE